MTKTICLEYGYYKSSATLLLNNTKTGKNKAIKLYLNNNDQIIPTQIMLTYSQINKLKGHHQLDYDFLMTLGEMKIGDHLKTNESSKIFSHFRLPPKYFDTLYDKSDLIIQNNNITRGMIMACFVFALVNNIFKYNSDYLKEDDRKDLTILIGSLADHHWGSEEAVEKYRDLIRKATGIDHVELILL
ncbi:MAG: hypothetical protein LUG12_02545 [Erysipelotrichaceae bacterium]|nr:hypothetical protein [Erysipelotrichaceae bacterium]